jgi:hypothetical protein
MGALLARVLAAVKFEWGNLSMMYEPYRNSAVQSSLQVATNKILHFTGFHILISWNSVPKTYYWHGDILSTETTVIAAASRAIGLTSKSYLSTIHSA